VTDPARRNPVAQESYLPLREAVRRLAAEPGAPANAFEWYRRDAHKRGAVALGGTDVPAIKQGRSWVVPTRAINVAIAAAKRARKRIGDATQAYEKEVLVGEDGETIHTTWGGYRRHGPFRNEWSDKDRYQQRSDGMWLCNSCNLPALLQHEKPTCHRCEDWGGCGKDCTLSGVKCQGCGAQLRL